jgi:transketolase
MTIGFDKPLYVLPFDHRGSFQTKMFGWHGALIPEQTSTFGWERYTGLEGRIIGMKTFGASAPLKELQRKFGFEPGLVVKAAKQLLGR